MLSPTIRIQAYRHRSFVEQRPAPIVAPWLGGYYEGLLKPFDLVADASLLETGKNNDFLSMASEVIRDLQSDCTLTDAGLFLMANQTLDSYFPFRSTTTRLCREFNIEAPAIGMTEQELSSPYIALTTLLAAFRQESFVGSGLLLVLDQATLPYARPGSTGDDIDNALIIKLTADPHVTGVSVSGKRYWTEPRSRRPSWISDCMYAYLDGHRVNLPDVHLVIDGTIDSSIADTLDATTCSIADPRYMSSAGLLMTLELIEKGAGHVLLAHMSNDGHLYLFSFDRDSAAQQGQSCSI